MGVELDEEDDAMLPPYGDHDALLIDQQLKLEVFRIFERLIVQDLSYLNKLSDPIDTFYTPNCYVYLIKACFSH